MGAFPHPESEEMRRGSANRCNALPAVLASCFIGLFVTGDIIKGFWRIPETKMKYA